MVPEDNHFQALAYSLIMPGISVQSLWLYNGILGQLDSHDYLENQALCKFNFFHVSISESNRVQCRDLRCLDKSPPKMFCRQFRNGTLSDTIHSVELHCRQARINAEARVGYGPHVCMGSKGYNVTAKPKIYPEKNP